MMTAKKVKKEPASDESILEDDDVGEVQLSEYMMLLFAVDVFARHVEETTSLPANDAHTTKGIRLLQQADLRYADAIRAHIIDKLPNESTKAMVARTFRVRLSNEVQVGRRCISLRTALNRSAAILKAIFEESRPRNAVKASMAASMTEDAAPALARFESLPVRNSRIKAWIRRASELVGSGEIIQNPVVSANAAALDHVETLKNEKMIEEATTGAEEVQGSQTQRSQTLEKVEKEATEAARAALEVSGIEDRPLTKSEVIGVATAVAAAQAADITHSTNVPASLKTLDPEQRAAALTDGQVLVAAGAGAGKSTTLVARVRYLVEELGVPPEKIMVTSFNRKAAKELVAKISKAIGPEKAKRMQVGTMHSLFRRSIEKYGSAAEKAMFKGADQNMLSGGPIATTVNQIWRRAFATWDDYKEEWEKRDAPPAKAMMLAKTKWLGEGVSPAQARAAAVTTEEKTAALWYEMYEALKGRVPWPRDEFPGDKKGVEATVNHFILKNRTTQSEDGEDVVRPLGDYDDMIRVFADILERSPQIRARAQTAFQHIMIDECQDLNAEQARALKYMTEHVAAGKPNTSFWMVGDPDQCVSVDTLVAISAQESVRAGDLVAGDEVLSYRNGAFVKQQVRHKLPSRWTEGIKIVTESGKSLTMSPNHKIWAQLPGLEGSQHIVYLMYRADMGFRVGITNKTWSVVNPFGSRPRSENADRMWVLEIAEDREAALLMEESYSLRFGIPTCVFNGTERGLNQDRLDAVFREFGSRGTALMVARHLSFDHPHWMASGYTNGTSARRVVNLLAHADGGSQVRLEWTGPQFDDVLRNGEIRVDVQTTARPGYRRVRKWFTNYREALTFAEVLAEVTASALRERLAVDGEKWPLLTAGSLAPGMTVAVSNAGELDIERIVSVERDVPAKFVDLDVDDASNFVGGGILSHNSIYAFRGARPELFVGLDGKEGWKTRLIRTNYRCPPEIVECANKLIAHNAARMEKDALAAPSRPRGEASIEATVYRDESSTALAIASEIQGRWDLGKGVPAQDNAVLCPTNSELDSYELALLSKGIPYARKGSSSFLSSPETKAFLGYMTLATDSDAVKSQEALANILNKPNRFFVNDEKKLKSAVQFAVNNYAKANGVTRAEVDAVVAMRDPRFQRDLIAGLDRQSSRSAPRLMQELSDRLSELANMAQDDTTNTKDLFNAILEVPGIDLEVDPNNPRRMIESSVSFKDSLRRRKQDAVASAVEADDDDDDDEDLDTSSSTVGPGEGLGAISFLYELSNQDPNDPMDTALPPDKPKGFWSKMERLKERAGELRYDLNKWNKDEPPPAVYLGTVHCSPADEPVLTTDGWVPIGSLDSNRHRLASYTHSCNQLFWGQVKGDHDGIAGYGFLKAVNPYEGPLLTLSTPRSKTRVTPDHRIRVKWSESFFNKYVVYLMRRGDWWRVGLAKSGNRPYGGSDFKQRVCAEKADACWILSVHATRIEATLEEARVQGQYGITGLTFEASSHRRVSSDQLQRIHDAIKAQTGERVLRLLSDYGLDKRHPLYVGQGRDMDMRSAFDIQARNCLSGYMLLPVVSEAFVECSGPREVWTTPEWHEVTVSREPFKGEVYSLVVMPHRYYVSGGAVVHNSVKGAQWPYVTVQMTEGRFPMPTRHPEGADENAPEMQAREQAELEGYRRLAYVALTRPSKDLRIVAPETYNGKEAGMSRFLGEAGLTVGENVKPPEVGAPKTAELFFEDAGVF